MLKMMMKYVLLTPLALLVVWAAYAMLFRMFCPTECPKLFGWSEAGIISGSMEPTISQGDHVIFREQERYEINDIVVYYDETDGTFVVHRIVGMNNGKFILQGDFNPECDPNPVGIEHMQGKVIYTIPGLQNVLWVLFGILLTLSVQYMADFFGQLKNNHKERSIQTDEKQII